ncbi:MAG TPA: hypothetical protein VKA91_01665 [Nitrososphaeraceae archaeon]|nr:hypothetical protein [Nitrososphaeraceae archaeon]
MINYLKIKEKSRDSVSRQLSYCLSLSGIAMPLAVHVACGHVACGHVSTCMVHG